MKAGAAVFALICAVFASSCAAQTALRASACDEACLRVAADAYWSALSARDPTHLQRRSDAVFSENGVRLEFGEALWRTATEAHAPALTIADASTQSVVTFAQVKEADRPALAWSRLTMGEGGLRELETGVARRESASLFNPDFFLHDAAALQGVLPASARRSRAEFIAIAQAYLAALVDARAPAPSFAATCNRIENGVQSTNVVARGSPLSSRFTSMGCLEQFTTGSLQFVSRVRDARFPVVDEARGLVFVSAIFDHDGLARTEGGAAARPSASLPSPYSYLVGEVFKIVDGRIERIEAVLVMLPYGASRP